ncbi:MAG: chemotaxis protein CheD [Burkholderiaceae bacterium]
MKHLDNKLSIYLLPGDVVMADQRHVLRTTLGSCVSITLWHPARKVGVMSHFMLPTASDDDQGKLDGRYADIAMDMMLDKLASEKVNHRECQAKLLGGGKMFGGKGTFSIGIKNGHVARQLVLSHGIPLIAQDLFGDGHRKVVFDVRSGSVWSQQVNQNLAIAA